MELARTQVYAVWQKIRRLIALETDLTYPPWGDMHNGPWTTTNSTQPIPPSSNG